MSVASPLFPETHSITAFEPTPLHWNPLFRIGFRFCFCYFAVWIFLNGNSTVWQAVPIIGDGLGETAAYPPVFLANWVAPHVFHLKGVAAHSHPTGSGDTAISWITTGIFITIAMLGTLVWSIFDRRRCEYQTLLAWLRFGLRLSIGASLLGYGFYKLFPLQMPGLSLARLNEPVGQLSPMALLWTFIGASPVYEMFCGFAEIAAGLLLLVRRTALLGALVTAFVAANIVLYNFLFDVPVKLFSLHLLLGALFIALPDVGALYSFFWKHQPAAPGGVWVPPAKRLGFRRATFVFELVFLALVLSQSAIQATFGYRAVLASNRLHSPLQGAWQLQGAQADPALSAITQVFIEHAIDATTFWAVARRQDGEPAWGKLNTAQHTLTLGSNSGVRDLHYLAVGSNRLELKPAQEKGVPANRQYVLTRMQQPEEWPLLTRGFHLVSEYPYQR